MKKKTIEEHNEPFTKCRIFAAKIVQLCPIAVDITGNGTRCQKHTHTHTLTHTQKKEKKKAGAGVGIDSGAGVARSRASSV